MPLLILFGCAGLIAGSFIAALAWRWPRGLSVASGRSRCDSCAVVLQPIDLVPVLSYLWNKGRCRRCGAAIPGRHVMIELAAAGMGAVAALTAATFGQAIVSAALGWWLLALIVLDTEQLWLPDRLTLPLGLAGLVAGIWLSPSLASRAAGAGLGFVLLAGVAAWYRHRRGREGLGGGDPKLLAALGAWLGAPAVPLVMLGGALLGLLTVAMARLGGRTMAATDKLPFGALMAAAAWPLWLARPALVARGWLP